MTKAVNDRVNLTIDGVDVAAEPGTLIIRAAEQMGVRIPRFCDHPLLKPVGACRQCLVEVGTADAEGNVRMMPKLQPSCAIPVSAGMVVKTQHTSEEAMTAQVGNMEFLLINHPLDCPICDKGGECPLQNQAMTEGRDTSRFTSAKRVYLKPMRLTSQILLDRDRCILCQRCVRFGKEIPGDAFLDLQGRGGGSSPTDKYYFMPEQIGSFDAEILDYYVEGVTGPERTDISGPYGREGIISSVYSGPERKSDRDLSGRSFSSYFSGNVIQICPVGALTSTAYRFQARPFDLVSTPSVTEHDASGSTIRVDVRRGRVVRRLSGDDPEVNEEWITDKDRFAFDWTNTPERLTVPLVRDNGKLVPTSWSEAIDIVASRLAEEKQNGDVGLLPGGRLSFEDAWAWSKFARKTLGTNNVDFRWREQSAEEADFLAAVVAGRGLGVTYTDVENASHVLLVALEPEDECGSLFLRLRKGVTAGKTTVSTVAPFLTRGNEKLSATLRVARPGAETPVVEAITELPSGTIILVGERAARTPGLLSAVTELSHRAGASLQWVPRRSGDRGSLEAGLLPGLLPFGRPTLDAAATASVGWDPELSFSKISGPGLAAADLVRRAADGGVSALVIGGVDLRDWPDPGEARKAIEKANFVVSLEVNRSEVTELADVVLPVAPAVEKNGTFINWEGRLRPFGQAISSRALPDREVLGMIAQEIGTPLGVDSLALIYEEANPLMRWRGTRAAHPTVSAEPSAVAPEGKLVLTFHKPQVDLGRLFAGAPDLANSARTPVALVSPATLNQLALTEDQQVTVTGPRGALTLPVESAGLPDGVVWLPECSLGGGIHQDVGQSLSLVTVTPAMEVSD